MTSELDRIRELLYDRSLILLDFHGLVCDLFAGPGAMEIAAELRALVRGLGGPAIAAHVDDPLAVLICTGQVAPDLVGPVDDALRTAELDAVATAVPIPGIQDVLAACADTHREVAIISNNSTPAIEAYLARHHLADLVSIVAGRPAGRPEFMKPDTYLIDRVLEETSSQPAWCVMVAGSPADIWAARAAAVAAIGYAIQPPEQGPLGEADAVVTDLAILAEAVRASERERQREMLPRPHEADAVSIMIHQVSAGWHFALFTTERITRGGFEVEPSEPFEAVAARAEELVSVLFGRPIRLRWAAIAPDAWSGQPENAAD